MPLGARLVLMLLFGVAGVHHARHLEKKYDGRKAWGLPSWAWGLIAAVSLLLGAILLYVAERGLKNQPTYPVQQQTWGYGQQAPFAAAQAVAPAVPAVPAAAIPAQVPAGWHPDPSGRHQHRWWDGASWTSHVSTNGVAAVD